jgi:hypothetical protein
MAYINGIQDTLFSDRGSVRSAIQQHIYYGDPTETGSSVSTVTSL